MIVIFGVTLTYGQLFKAAGALILILIGSILFRQNNAIVRKREERDKIINDILSPFNDAILNIEHGEHNHVMIINSFFTTQNESISRAKAIANEKNKNKIETAWQNYASFCEKNGKGELYTRFGTFPKEFDEEKKKNIKSHISKLIKLIERI